eukprot:Pompholyxophrys_sp_v1_NODE_194_length_1242_cov_99.133951.p4 type:complete len:101 gc:universal NODE_194_length_1242_cov_99.133951:931-1233(+)
MLSIPLNGNLKLMVNTGLASLPPKFRFMFTISFKFTFSASASVRVEGTNTVAEISFTITRINFELTLTICEPQRSPLCTSVSKWCKGGTSFVKFIRALAT